MPGRIVEGIGWVTDTGYCPECASAAHELWTRGSNKFFDTCEKFKLRLVRWITKKKSKRYGWHCPICDYRQKSKRTL